MNSFHEQLTENLIKDKKLSNVKQQEDNDDVFVSNENNIHQEDNIEENELEMKEFARGWVHSIKRSPYKNEIFRGLSAEFGKT